MGTKRPPGWSAAAAVALCLLGGCENRASDNAASPAQAASPAAGAHPPRAPGDADFLPPDGPTAADYPHLHNLLEITERIYTGGEPVGDPGFAELARIGVRTVVSVDGAKPDIEAAKRHGLRYVHIPVGYEGISQEAGQSLARLVAEAEGPYYIHCHHGNHRGPAAAAVACIADGAADGESALAILEKAGTSRGYGGLWRDVAAYQPPPDGQALPELVEVAEVDSLAAAMAQIDRDVDHLQQCQAAQWKAPPDHPDLDPAQQALLLKEDFRETARQLRESSPYGAKLLEWMREAEGTAARLEEDLVAGRTNEASAALVAIRGQCKRCHERYRN